MSGDETKDNQYVVGRTERVLSQLEEEPKQIAPGINPYEENINNGTWEYPKTKKPPYAVSNDIVKRGGPISPGDHTLRPIPVLPNGANNLGEFFVPWTKGHTTRDVTQNIEGERSSTFVNDDADIYRLGFVGNNMDTVEVFSGATTNVNQRNDPVTDEMIKAGTLSHYIEDVNRSKELGDYNGVPISPLHPFTRLNSPKNRYAADAAIFNSYNRTKLPVADIEWRKGFRHIFITRPECYVTCTEGGLCKQAENDEDFASEYTRMPHIVNLLSPRYVYHQFSSEYPNANWNFLLSNRVQGMSSSGTSLTMNENVGKSIEGFTVIPGMHLESRQGSTLDLSFKDTKRLEVYEYARMWQLYIHKRKKGIFTPPFNGYARENAFDVINEKKPLNGMEFINRHPYDRALEYCSTIYDIITNESGTKILYWCKYYGVYPVAISTGLSNEANAPITDMTTSITFKYAAKIENRNTTLVEFNYDAGLTDHLGNVVDSTVSNSLPFLLRNEYDDPVLKQYVGAAGMFAGSPYIVMERSRVDPVKGSGIIVEPFLRFMNMDDIHLEPFINASLMNNKINQPSKNVIGYQD